MRYQPEPVEGGREEGGRERESESEDDPTVTWYH